MLDRLSQSMLTAGASWWDILPVESRLLFSIVLFLVNLLVLTSVVYLAGLVIVGRKRALAGDAVIISLFGTVFTTMFSIFISYHFLALFLSLLVWLLLMKRLYETGWLGAIAVGILAMAIFLAITAILALVFGIFAAIWELFSSPFATIL